MVVREAGADEVIVGDDLEPGRAFGPYDLIIESLGGKALKSALSLLAPDERQSIATAEWTWTAPAPSRTGRRSEPLQ